MRTSRKIELSIAGENEGRSGIEHAGGGRSGRNTLEGVAAVSNGLEEGRSGIKHAGGGRSGIIHAGYVSSSTKHELDGVAAAGARWRGLQRSETR